MVFHRATMNNPWAWKWTVRYYIVRIKCMFFTTVAAAFKTSGVFSDAS